MSETIRSSKPERPLGVTLLALLVFTIAGLNLLRLIQTLREWSFLTGLSGINPLYMVISGTVWLVVCAWVGWGLWRGKRWAALATILAMLAYMAYTWIDILFVAEDGAQTVNWPFVLALQLVLISFAGLVLIGKKAKRFFGDIHDG